MRISNADSLGRESAKSLISRLSTGGVGGAGCRCFATAPPFIWRASATRISCSHFLVQIGVTRAQPAGLGFGAHGLAEDGLRPERSAQSTIARCGVESPPPTIFCTSSSISVGMMARASWPMRRHGAHQTGLLFRAGTYEVLTDDDRQAEGFQELGKVADGVALVQEWPESTRCRPMRPI